MNNYPSFFTRSITRALGAILIVWLFGFLVPETVLMPLRSILAPVVAPVQGFLSWTAFETRDFFQFVTSIGELKQQNEQLIRENQRLAAEAARLPEVQEENRLLRQTLALPALNQFQRLSAEVISRDTQGTSFSATLNRGSTDGVRIGWPVVVGDTQLVGRITAVQLTSATMQLLSHPTSTVAARITGTSIQGVIRGDHGLGLIFDMALSGEKLIPGSRLVTTGLGDELPKDLYIGAIGEARPSADRLFQQASVLTDSAESDIRFVSIIFPPV